MGLVATTFNDLFEFTRSSEGAYYDAGGVLRVAGVDEPRFNHDPITAAAIGIRFETPSTNLISWSETDGSNWPITNNSSHWAGTPMAHRGVTMDRYTRGGISVLDTPSTSNAATVQMFFYDDGTNPGDTQVIRLVMRDADGTDLTQRVITFSYVTKNFGINAEDGTESWSAIHLGDDLYHIILTIDDPSLTNVTTLRVATYGDNRWMGGFQLEESDHASSYIRTGADPVTRQADVLGRTLGKEYSPDGFSFYVEGDQTNDYGAMLHYFGANSLRVGVPANAAGNVVTGPVSIPLSTFENYTPGDHARIAVSISATTLTVALNGELHSTPIDGVPAVYRVTIGSFDGSAAIDGHIQDFQAFNIVLTDSKLIELTGGAV